MADFQREATTAAGSVERVSREQSSDRDTLFWDGWKIAVWFCPRTPLINAQQIQSEIHWFLLGKTQVAERVCIWGLVTHLCIYFPLSTFSTNMKLVEDCQQNPLLGDKKYF